MDLYKDHPHVEHVLTESTCLWENWEAAARACDTPYFAWLQDDDVISRFYAKRVVHAMERWPDITHWQRLMPQRLKTGSLRRGLAAMAHGCPLR